jgi:hypothetical protein
MDYVIGFLIGYSLKEIGLLLNKLSKWDYDNRFTSDYESSPLTEDDLP